LTRYLELGDYLLIAEAVLEIPSERLARLERIGLAESALPAPAAEFEGTEDSVIRGVAGGTVSQASLADWIRTRLAPE
jgi:hypothetical protein